MSNVRSWTNASKTHFKIWFWSNYHLFIWWLIWPKVTCRVVSTYKLMPIPIASVATNTLQGSLGLLNFWAWANFVAVQHWIETSITTSFYIILHVGKFSKLPSLDIPIKWTLRKSFEILRQDIVFVGISFLTFKTIK